MAGCRVAVVWSDLLGLANGRKFRCPVSSFPHRLSVAALTSQTSGEECPLQKNSDSSSELRKNPASSVYAINVRGEGRTSVPRSFPISVASIAVFGGYDPLPITLARFQFYRDLRRVGITARRQEYFSTRCSLKYRPRSPRPAFHPVRCP